MFILYTLLLLFILYTLWLYTMYVVYILDHCLLYVRRKFVHSTSMVLYWKWYRHRVYGVRVYTCVVCRLMSASASTSTSKLIQTYTVVVTFKTEQSHSTIVTSHTSTTYCCIYYTLYKLINISISISISIDAQHTHTQKKTVELMDFGSLDRVELIVLLHDQNSLDRRLVREKKHHTDSFFSIGSVFFQITSKLI